MVSRALILEASQCEYENEVYDLSLHNRQLRSMLGLSSCTRLRVLDLSFNSLQLIEGLEALGDLRELRLYANAITHVRGMESNSKLTTLLLHDNNLGPAPAAGSSLPLPTRLETLRIDLNPALGAAGLALFRLDRLPALTELNASSTNLQSADGLRGMLAIQTLHLERNGISMLGAVSTMSTLKELYLGHNALVSASLPSLGRLSALSLLRLDANRIDDLAPLPRLPALVELYLGGNAVSALPPLMRPSLARTDASPKHARATTGARRMSSRGGAGRAVGDRRGGKDSGAAAGRGLRAGPRGAAEGYDEGTEEEVVTTKEMDGDDAVAGDDAADVEGEGGEADPTLLMLLPALEVLDLSNNSLASPGALGPLSREALPQLAELRVQGNGMCTDAAAAATLVESVRGSFGDQILLEYVADDDADRSALAAREPVAGDRPGTASGRPDGAGESVANGIPLVRPPRSRHGVLVPMQSVDNVEAAAEAVRRKIADVRARIATAGSHSLLPDGVARAEMDAARATAAASASVPIGTATADEPSGGNPENEEDSRATQAAHPASSQPSLAGHPSDARRGLMEPSPSHLPQPSPALVFAALAEVGGAETAEEERHEAAGEAELARHRALLTEQVGGSQCPKGQRAGLGDVGLGGRGLSGAGTHRSRLEEARRFSRKSSNMAEEAAAGEPRPPSAIRRSMAIRVITAADTPDSASDDPAVELANTPGGCRDPSDSASGDPAGEGSGMAQILFVDDGIAADPDTSPSWDGRCSGSPPAPSRRPSSARRGPPLPHEMAGYASFKLPNSAMKDLKRPTRAGKGPLTN